MPVLSAERETNPPDLRALANRGAMGLNCRSLDFHFDSQAGGITCIACALCVCIAYNVASQFTLPCLLWVQWSTSRLQGTLTPADISSTDMANHDARWDPRVRAGQSYFSSFLSPCVYVDPRMFGEVCSLVVSPYVPRNVLWITCT